MKIKPFIYVCSPLRGDMERNINRARGYSLFVYSKGAIPMTPHLYFTQFLDDDIPEERVDGMDMGIQLLLKCDEIWIFGEKISEGMTLEIAAAKSQGLKIKRFSERCEEVAADNF